MRRQYLNWKYLFEGGRVCGVVLKELTLNCTRCATTSYKWNHNQYKWSNKWVTGVIILLIGVITPFIVGWGPRCSVLGYDSFCPIGWVSRFCQLPNISCQGRQNTGEDGLGTCVLLQLWCFSRIFLSCSERTKEFDVNGSCGLHSGINFSDKSLA